ncbi:sigma-70 family RNA polymerase sigma factor [Bremerella sp. JC817]|uniref:sigma-70 family RNA polymerase sigma factor n=1 Tax=Bremerella sp. JC817 TaxID=3231756 RepID=UPI003459F817
MRGSRTDIITSEVSVRSESPGERSSQEATDEWFRGEIDSIQRILISFVASLVRDPHLVNDVVQETNLVIWKKRDSFTPGTNFRSWSLRIAYFQSLAALKSAQSSRLMFSQALVDRFTHDAENSTSILTQDTSDRLRVCLSRLTPRQREVIELRYQQSCSIGLITEKLGRTQAAIGMLLNRARTALLQCLKMGERE